MPKVEYLSKILSRTYFCREAALVRLSNGLDKIACRDYGRERTDCYDLYLDNVPLVKTHIANCGTCGTLLRKGYGDGIYGREDCAAVSEKLNGSYNGLKNAVADIEPILGLMKSGIYIVADFDLMPVINSSAKPEYFWDVADESYRGGNYHEELHFVQYYKGGEDYYDFPTLLAPSQRAALINMDRVEYYRRRVGEGDSFPRAVALYLNGAVALLLDGHHKAMACALEGAPIRTLVIFRATGDEEALSAAAKSKNRLYLCHYRRNIRAKYMNDFDTKDDSGFDNWTNTKGLVLFEGGDPISGVSCLETMERRRIKDTKSEPPEWGTVPPELYTDSWKKYPNFWRVCNATRVPPDMIRTVFTAERNKPEGTWDQDNISALWAYARLFPDSKWLTAEDKKWLDDVDERTYYY